MARIVKFGTINMLTAGLFDGWISIGEIASRGEIGLGSFHALDGEMVMLDGEVFRMGTDAVPHPVDPTTTTPFAVVGAFETPESFELAHCEDWDALATELDARLVDPNRPAMIRIRGRFTRTRARSVPAQSKPYPSLGEVAAHQTVHELPAFEGTMVGFHFPEYLQAIDVVGWHLHVIDDDRRHGGHLLDVSIERATVTIEPVGGFEVLLPDDPAFREATLVADTHAEVQRAERG